jgi:non-heme chloroperoxidase
MPYCEVADQLQLYYEDFGNGSPIVFTNAGNLTHKMWMGQVAGLAAEFRTVTYDLRGTGNSSKPRGPYTAEAAAADLCTLIAKLDVAPVTLVAHGIGTHIVIMAADARPDLVSGMALMSGGPWFSGERDGVTAGLAREFLEFLADRTNRGVPYAVICEEMIEKWLFLKAQGAGSVHLLLEQALTWPQYVLNCFSQSMRDVDQRERLARIACPALIVHGRHDRKQLYAGAAHTAGLLQNARLVTLEQSAHMGQVEEINTFNHALAAFVREVEAVQHAA